MARLSVDFLSSAGKLADAFAGIGKTLIRDVSVSGRALLVWTHGGAEFGCAIPLDAIIWSEGRIEGLVRPVSPFSKAVSAGRQVGRVIRTVSFPGMAGSIMGTQIRVQSCEISP